MSQVVNRDHWSRLWRRSRRIAEAGSRFHTALQDNSRLSSRVGGEKDNHDESFDLLSMGCLLCVFGGGLAQEPADVKVEKNVSYLPPDRGEQADLYLPPKFEEGKKYPGVLIIHGGGWTEKARRGAQINIGTTLASHGYVCMSIDYLLHDPASDKPCWPQNLQDCKTAVRWMRANRGAAAPRRRPHRCNWRLGGRSPVVHGRRDSAPRWSRSGRPLWRSIVRGELCR